MAQRRGFGWKAVLGWVALAIVLVVMIDAADKAPPESETPEERAAIIANALTRTSVYVEPGAPDLVDPDPSRRAIGDRPILVAILASPPSSTLCQDILNYSSGNVLLVLGEHPDEDHVECGRRDFDQSILTSAELAATYRVTAEDWTPLVEEFVYAFDAHTDHVEAREWVPHTYAPSAATDRRYALITLVIVVIVAFMCWLYVALAGHTDSRWRRAKDAAALREWRIVTDSRLNRLADVVIGADVDSDTARRYVLLLEGFETARSDEDRTEVDRSVRGLEERVGLPPSVESTPRERRAGWSRRRRRRPSMRRRRR
jgi:hypothetical protein